MNSADRFFATCLLSLLTFIFKLTIMDGIGVIEYIEVDKFLDTEGIKTICLLSVSLECVVRSCGQGL